MVKPDKETPKRSPHDTASGRPPIAHQVPFRVSTVPTTDKHHKEQFGGKSTKKNHQPQQG